MRPCQFAGLRPFVAAPHFNVYFARAVIEGHIAGSVYSNDLEGPKAAYILHPCGMSLLSGKVDLEPFTGEIVEYMLDKKRMRRHPELVQVFPDAWQEELSTRLGTRLLRLDDPRRRGLSPSGVQELGKAGVVEWGRVNFDFDRDAFRSTEELSLPSGLHLQRAGKSVFHPWDGPVLPNSFWSSPEEFEKKGIAFAISRQAAPFAWRSRPGYLTMPWKSG